MRLDDEIARAVERIRRNPAFADERWWLTLHLTGQPPRLEALQDPLRELGAVNLEGAEVAFIYPKLETSADAAAIAATVAQVKRLAEAAGVQLFAVDADTSPDVRRSTFEPIIEF